MTSLIDVVLLLLIFFMMSTRVRRRVASAGASAGGRVQPDASALRDAVEIEVTAEGGYRVNGRDAHQQQPGHAVGALSRAASGQPGRARDHPGGRSRHASVRGHGDGRRGTAWLPADQHRHGPRWIRRAVTKRARAGADRRLARPTAGCSGTCGRTRACSLFGVLGMIDVCGHGCGLGRVRALLPRRHVRRAATRAWSGWCRRPWSACSCCAASAISCRPTALDTSGGTSSRRCAPRSSIATCTCPSPIFDSQASGTLLSQLTYNTEQVAQATTDSITVFIRDTLTIVGLLGYLLYLNWRLTLFSLIVGPLIALPDPPHQPAVPPLQRADPGLDGRRHAGCEGGDRGAACGPRVQRAGSPGADVRDR